ncbi:MAG: DUF1489 domain-containing protein [Parvularculaceae bacterium]
MTIHLVKLCVGAEGVDDLRDWRERGLAERQQQNRSPHMFHTTRMWPRREPELLDGGSLYWVIKGMILVRQPIFKLEECIGEDDIRRCKILLEPKLILTQPMPRRPFQGWRYLKPEDAPKDLPHGRAQLDQALAGELAELGLL